MMCVLVVVYSVPLWYMLSVQPLRPLFCNGYNLHLECSMLNEQPLPPLFCNGYNLHLECSMLNEQPLPPLFCNGYNLHLECSMLNEQPSSPLFCCSAMVRMFISNVPCWTNSLYRLCATMVKSVRLIWYRRWFHNYWAIAVICKSKCLSSTKLTSSWCHFFPDIYR